MQILMANPEDGSPRQLARISGSRLSNWLLMQPVLSPDGKWLAELLTDGPTTNSLGPANRRRTDASHYRLWPPGHLHSQKDFLVFRRALCLCRSRQGRGGHCVAQQPEVMVRRNSRLTSFLTTPCTGFLSPLPARPYNPRLSRILACSERLRWCGNVPANAGPR